MGTSSKFKLTPNLSIFSGNDLSLHTPMNYQRQQHVNIFKQHLYQNNSSIIHIPKVKNTQYAYANDPYDSNKELSL